MQDKGVAPYAATPGHTSPAMRAGRRETPRFGTACGTFYEELCKVENGINFPGMALVMALIRVQALLPQGKFRHYRWRKPQKTQFWRITSWQKKK